MAEEVQNPLDQQFYARADAFINLANDAITREEASAGQIANSLMFAASRFNAWVASASYKESSALEKDREEILEFFTKQYNLMLAENLDSYIENFDDYLNHAKPSK